MTTKKLALTAMGIALFVVLSLCLQVPVFENYYLCLGYVVMTVGTLGVALYCLLTNGLRGMPGWAAGNVVVALGISAAFKATARLRPWLRQLLLTAAIVLFTAAGILGVKSLVEMVLYAQPFLIRAAKNVYAFVADIVVMTLSLPICASLEKVIRKLFPKEISAA